MGEYCCDSAAETLRWVEAIVEFLRPLSFLTHPHSVNFFTHRLWLALDPLWLPSLASEPLPSLLRLPSGAIQDHWPDSLKKFLATLNSLVLPRNQRHLEKVFPGLAVSPLNSVLAQGMNPKKQHEVRILSALVDSVAESVGAQKIVDVGAGQGYLSQVLSFHYQRSVVAIDASSHHGKVTEARAERIKKYYASQLRKSKSGHRSLIMPKTITCNLMSIDMLRDLACLASKNDLNELDHGSYCAKMQNNLCRADGETSVVLAGLHACGDLSVMMLKAFLGCKQVKAVVSIGCCYNLLSEGGINVADSEYGFPVSRGVKSSGFSLGKNLRDLACQSAERWNCLESDAGMDNFELHTFRAAFQMVLSKYYPEVMDTSPSIGRQGKALRRRQKKAISESFPPYEEFSFCQMLSKTKENNPYSPNTGFETDDIASLCSGDSIKGSENGELKSDKLTHFESYCHSGLRHLGLKPLPEIDFSAVWKEVEPVSELIGPFWTLRAALAPLIETFLLLDRLLLLQESGDSVEAFMLPIFDPVVSPRNVAIIAKRIDRE